MNQPNAREAPYNPTCPHTEIKPDELTLTVHCIQCGQALNTYQLWKRERKTNIRLQQQLDALLKSKGLPPKKNNPDDLFETI